MIRRFLLLCAVPALMLAQSGKLSIYWVDVEGGGATLMVTPSGQALLVDTGNPAPDDRDAKRIYEAAQLAGLKKIDYLLTTHFHGDHVGGLPALVKLIPIDHYLDHGDSMELQNPRDQARFDAYKAIVEGKRTIVKVGDRVPLKDVRVEIVSSNGEVLAKPINGGGANPHCADAVRKDPDKTENQRSAGILVTFGKFTFLNVADLTWDKEMELACPVNKLGTVTVFQATHHGFYGDLSGAPAFIAAVQPQVVVVNNGPMKGLPASAWERMAKIAGVEGIWQGHVSLATDKAHNTTEEMIANPEATAQCKGNWIKLTVSADGKYSVTNGRNGFSKDYNAR